MSGADVKQVAKKLIKNAPIAILSTLNKEGFPESRAMLNLNKLNDNDNFFIWFSTNTSSKKIKQIQNNTKANAYFTVHQDWQGVLLQGEINIVDDISMKKKVWEPGWEMYYPKGVTDPDYSVLLLKPKKICVYSDLKKEFFEM